LEGQHETVINILVNSRNGCKLTVPDGPRKMNTFAAAGEDKALRLYFKSDSLSVWLRPICGLIAPWQVWGLVAMQGRSWALALARGFIGWAQERC
jgi:hypothetical protein